MPLHQFENVTVSVRSRQDGSSVGGAEFHLWVCNHDAKVCGNGPLNDVERIDRSNQNDSAEQGGRQVIDVATRQLLLGDECREEYVAPIERIAEQRTHPIAG